MHSLILQHFGLAPAALLGKGSESSVYALDQTRVLRVYGWDAALAYLQARASFYTQLAGHRPRFAIPQVLDQGVIDGQPYTIEQRMPGHDLAHVLPQLTGQDRVRALVSYLDLAAQIGTIELPDAPFGEILCPGVALQRHTWAQYLCDRVRQALGTSRDDIVQDVPQIDQLLAAFYARVQQLPPLHTKALVHGDYFPGNVFIDATLTVYGVGDFGYSTLVGDPRMDIAGAVIFLELVQGYQESDTQMLLDHLKTQAYGVGADVIELYRIYYSLYFSFCRHSDPPLYAWCVRNLLSFRYAPPDGAGQGAII